MSIASRIGISEEIVQYFHNNFVTNNKQVLVELLKELSKRGCSKLQIVFLLVDEGKLDFRQANLLVLNELP
jgi:hypothetical protein